MMELPPLPGLPALDAQTERVEVWALMQDYAKNYGELCARMAREEETYIIEMLVAAGHVTAEKVAQARDIADAIRSES